jgi:hypothetical protein
MEDTTAWDSIVREAQGTKEGKERERKNNQWLVIDIKRVSIYLLPFVFYSFSFVYLLIYVITVQFDNIVPHSFFSVSQVLYIISRRRRSGVLSPLFSSQQQHKEVK